MRRVLAGGNTDNGAGQWDGFVGRLVRPLGVAATTRFHSVVGGVQQDGLFGIAEIDQNRFVAVGSSGTSGVVGAGNANFPFQQLCLAAAVAPYSIGVVMVFDASTVGTPIGLTLDSAVPIGVAAAGTNTVVRDVLVQPDYVSGFPLATVVGSTDDPGLLTTGLLTGLTVGPQTVIGGGVDGFIVSAAVFPAAVNFTAGTFRGTAGNEVLTGVNGWNEFTDQFVAVGYRPSAIAGGGIDIDVASYVVDSSASGPTPYVALTEAQIGGNGLDYPTAVGAINATTLGGFAQFGLGDPAGGGVAVSETGRVNVVGTTASTNYPVTPAGVFPAGRNKTGVANDGVRTVLDLLPASTNAQPFAAVGRTDGTGPLPIGGPAYPLAGFFGGSTPQCALQQFGKQIGVVPPALSMRRMLIDYAGQLPAAGAAISLVVTRPPASLAQVSAWQIGFPGAGPTFAPAVLPEGVILWTNSATVVTFVHNSADATLVEPFTLPTFGGPAFPVTFTVQLVSVATTPVAGGAVGLGPCPGTSTLAASPAMWISF